MAPSLAPVVNLPMAAAYVDGRVKRQLCSVSVAERSFVWLLATKDWLEECAYSKNDPNSRESVCLASGAYAFHFRFLHCCVPQVSNPSDAPGHRACLTHCEARDSASVFFRIAIYLLPRNFPPHCSFFINRKNISLKERFFMKLLLLSTVCLLRSKLTDTPDHSLRPYFL